MRRGRDEGAFILTGVEEEEEEEEEEGEGEDEREEMGEAGSVVTLPEGKWEGDGEEELNARLRVLRLPKAFDRLCGFE